MEVYQIPVAVIDGLREFVETGIQQQELETRLRTLIDVFYEHRAVEQRALARQRKDAQCSQSVSSCFSICAHEAQRTEK